MPRLDHADLQQALQHERALRRLAAGLLRDPADVDDAVQHALVQEACGRRQPGVPLWPFLHRTLRRHASNLRKLAARRSGRERAAARPEAVPGVAAMLQKEQLRRRVADAVLGLDEPYRTTVWLRWFEELPAGEVAARMQVPIATVRTRLARAHERLRQRLDRDYGDRRWAAFALPAVGVPALLGLATVVTMKQMLAVAVVILIAVLGYSLLPPLSRDAAAPEAGAHPVAAVNAANPAAPVANQREEVAIPGVMAPAVASTLRITNSDGSPAALLPVWLWTAASRPGWTERVEAAPSVGYWPAGIGSVPATAPPASTLRTDADGCVALASDATLVTVLCAPFLWFSAPLPLPPAPLVLPELVPVEATLQGAPAGKSWEALFYAGFRNDDGGDTHGRMRWNFDTKSGPGVIRMDARNLRMQVGEDLRALAPPGQYCAIEAWGHGFEIAEPLRTVVAPGSAQFHYLRPLPCLVVTVAEADGVPTKEQGMVSVQFPDGWTSAALEDGRAIFDVRDQDADHSRIDVMLDDGEWLHAVAKWRPGQLQQEVTLSRNQGTPPLRVALPDLPATTDILCVRFENATHRFVDAGAAVSFTDGRPDPVFSLAAGELLLNVLPANWLSGIVVTRDARVATFAAANAGDRIAGSWLAAGPTESIDVGAIYAELGNRPAMQAMLQLQFRGGDDAVEWRTILFDRHYQQQDDPKPAPVWRDLQLPPSLHWRLLVSGGPTFDAMAVLREVALPRH